MDEKQPDDRRVSNRIESGNLVVHTTISGGNPPMEGLGVTLDVSEYGLRIQATDPLILGERYRFSLALGDNVVTATGQIVHIGRIPNNTFEMGVEFVEITVSAIEAIRSFLSARPSTL